MPTPPAGVPLTSLQRKVIGAVAVGAAVIAAIGFVGSYAAVRSLAVAKGFGAFALAFPIGLDAGILVLLALDLLLTWLRMPLGILRHTAWLLTAATIAFNAAAAWPDPVGTGMHAVIPVLFVVVIEAARHAVGQAADIVAGRRMESVRVSRWLLDPISTFRLWRRMKMWELRSYDDVIALEQQRLIERARLRARFGPRWRSKAPVDAVLALRLTRYGRALDAPIVSVLDAAPVPAASVPAVAASSPVVPSRPEAEPAIVVPRTDAQPSHTDAPDDFDTRAASAIAVTRQADAHLDPWPEKEPEPSAQPDADAQPDGGECAADTPDPAEEDAQPDALVLDLARMRPPHPDVCAPAPGTDAQPPARRSRRTSAARRSGARRGAVTVQLADGDAAYLEKARALNVQSLRDDGRRAPLRLLQTELGIGQARAQRIQAALPDTLAAALAEAQPHAKEA